MLKKGIQLEIITPWAAKEVDFETCRPVLRITFFDIIELKNGSKGKCAPRVYGLPFRLSKAGRRLDRLGSPERTSFFVDSRSDSAMKESPVRDARESIRLMMPD